MVKFCTNCGKKLNENQDVCLGCGIKIEKNSNFMTDNISNNSLTCPKCHSNNVNIQVVNESKLVTKHHGILWWLFIGWWWIFVKWIFLTVPALIFAIFVGKRKKIKNITKKIKVCQNCGHSW